MITIMKGNILDTECRAIANPTSCDGFINSEMSKEIQKNHSEMVSQYKKFCKEKVIDIGKLWLYKGKENDDWVLNFPIKKSNKTKSKLSYIEDGLDKLISTYNEKKIGSIALPLLGCDEGKLNREDVLSLMVDKLVDCDDLYIEIWV